LKLILEPGSDNESSLPGFRYQKLKPWCGAKALKRRKEGGKI
jgi:hypothetical protein